MILPNSGVAKKNWWLLYASTVWSLYTKKKHSSNQTEMVQRKAARWVSNNFSPYDSVSAMLSNLSWRSIEYPIMTPDSRYHGLIAVPMPSYFEHPETSVCSKILDHIIHSQIMRHLEINNVDLERSGHARAS